MTRLQLAAYAAITLPIILTVNYVAALFGHPTSHWLMHTLLGVM